MGERPHATRVANRAETVNLEKMKPEECAIVERSYDWLPQFDAEKIIVRVCRMSVSRRSTP